jgi:hypothetical protein
VSRDKIFHEVLYQGHHRVAPQTHDLVWSKLSCGFTVVEF